MTWTTPEDVQQAWLGERLEISTETVERWIDRAERKIKREIPNIEARIKAPEKEPDLLDTVRDVVSAMVERKLRNPDGLRSTTDTSGPFTRQTTHGGENPGALMLTAEEKAQLLPPEETTGRAFSVSIYDEASQQARWPSFVINGDGAWK